jgi:galactonate dehydratase
MKITRLTTTAIAAGPRNWLCVKVETDQPGLYGWGEATLEWKSRAVMGCVEDFAPMLIGKDPRDITRLTETMLKHSFWPLGVIGMTAVSAIEQSLWDILGKDCGRPVWQLLGGRARDRVKVYGHIGHTKKDFVRVPVDVEAYCDAAADLVERGYVAMKCNPTPFTHFAADRAATKTLEKLGRRLRETVGPDVDLLFDFHGRPTSVQAAAAYCNALAEAEPLFIEEPVQPGDADAMRAVADRTAVPLAAGERLITLREFQDLADRQAVTFLQPDLCHCGGFAAGRAIAAVAAQRGIGIAPHNPMGPIASVVGLHFAVATPNFVILEQASSRFPFFFDVFDTEIALQGGYWPVPERPGLGVEINLAEAAKRPFVQEGIQAKAAVAAHDGSIVNY